MEMKIRCLETRVQPDPVSAAAPLDSTPGENVSSWQSVNRKRTRNSASRTGNVEAFKSNKPQITRKTKISPATDMEMDIEDEDEDQDIQVPDYANATHWTPVIVGGNKNWYRLREEFSRLQSAKREQLRENKKEYYSYQLP